MALFKAFYVVFNQCECLIWWAFGAYFVWRDYAVRGQVALNPWRFVAAGVVLGLAVYGAIRGG